MLIRSFNNLFLPTQCQCFLSKKKDFTYAHLQFEATFNKCLLRRIGCTGTAIKYFTSVKVVVNSHRENQKHICACESCMRYIPVEEQYSKPYRLVSKGRVKKKANYPHFVDKRLTPHSHPHPAKLKIITLRNFFLIHI